MRERAVVAVSAALIFCALDAAPAWAQTWVGSESANWFDPDNWNPAVVPSAPNTVIIDVVTQSATVVSGTGADATAAGAWLAGE